MKYFPFFLQLNKLPCLVVGGGSVAERKLDLLVKANADITVISLDFSGYILELSKNHDIKCITGKYSEKFLEGNKYRFVISATNDVSLNEQVAKDCAKHNIIVNVVDQPEICDFIFPSILERGDITVAVSTGGASPVLARVLRTKLETMVPASYGKLADIVSSNRIKVRNKMKKFSSNKIFWEKMLNGKFLELVLSGKTDEAKSFLDKQIDDFDEDIANQGEVYLVGAGPGDPDLLTFKALRLMQQADIALYDRLVHPAIVDLIRRDATKIYVGKERDNHVVRQEEINDLLVKYAKDGKKVLRLKGGDPFIFGRGGEEIETLADEKIAFQVVPGITSASGCSTYSGIPLTHRDYAQSCIFVTGHLKEGKLELQWDKLIQPNQTIVFYMGLVSIDIICEQLVKHGLSESTPSALVQQGTTNTQIIGGVVSLRDKLKWYSSNVED